MLKKISIVLLFIVTSLTVLNAADYKQSIRSEFKKYFNTIQNQEFEKSLDYIIPQFFEIISKEDMVDLMKKTFNNPDLEITLSALELKKINEIDEIDNTAYCLFKYSNIMHMTIINMPGQGKPDKSSLDMIKSSFENDFGKDNVSLDYSTNTFEIYVVKQVCAVKEESYENWKFLEIDKKQQALLDMLLPQEIINKL